MPEAQYDPLGRRWVLLAPERARRGVPDVEPDTPDPAPCDFCAGHEDRTPPQVYVDVPDWRVRVVPNLYPATPVHEVVIHTPDHEQRFEEQSPEERAAVMRAYADRLGGIDVECAVVIWNRGRRAGASRSHAHGQLFGLDLVPPVIAREVEAFADGDCALCAFDLEIAPGVVAHPVPLVPHELLVVPPHEARPTDLEGFGDLVADAIGRIRTMLGDHTAFNLVWHLPPRGVDRFHWHAHLYPRTTTWGGLEVGAELPIVAADPAVTAETLRAVEP